MVGNNKLQLNEATMKIIVQEWVDRTVLLKPQPIVSGVKSVSSGYDHYFEILFTDDVEKS